MAHFKVGQTDSCAAYRDPRKIVLKTDSNQINEDTDHKIERDDDTYLVLI